MKPIIQLNAPLINKIAAGEVVERPLSVVKELTENAIDAGASMITVEISEGGLASIRVTDNGAGIPADQILLAFARHATSKIASLDDLFEVGTLGFRGEALSSIAAVAQVEMITKTNGAVMGVRVEIHGGQLISRQDIGAAGGTTVIVNNLFYNTPARRKFLKKPGTEAGYIADCLQKLALGNPNLTIRYINNGEIAFQTSGKGDLKTAMLNIYGREAAAKLVIIEAEMDRMKLSGLIGKPEIARGNRQRQSFFINSRLIQSGLLTKAVEEATRTMLPTGKFPVYALNLAVPYESVDVNVHPTKMDVRFADDEQVFRFIRGAVREALTESNLIPEARFGGRKEKESPLDQIPGEWNRRDAHRASAFDYKDEHGYSGQRGYNSQQGSNSQRKNSNQHENNSKSRQQNATPTDETAGSLNTPAKPRHDITDPQIHSVRPYTSPAQLPTAREIIAPRPSSANTPQPMALREAPQKTYESPQPFFADYRILGLVFGTYWLITQDESLYLIDQHAAHERVLYEEILELISTGPINAQQLLTPITLRLTPRETSLLKDNLSLFARFGFEISGPNENGPQQGAAIITVPYLLKGPVDTGFFTDLLDRLGETGFSGAGVYAHKTEALAMAACKAAVKAGDTLSEAEARGLVEKLLTLENPFTCPHGRPTIIEITRRELERRFKRT